MKNYILEQLNKFKNHTSYHMPGHKASEPFSELFKGAYLDITELPFSDDLSCPEGIIRNAQNDIAEILGAYKSYILTDGSTLGVLAMIYALSLRGKRLIIPRNSHKSVYNGCRLFGLQPAICATQLQNGIPLFPRLEDVETQLKNGDVAGVLITSPTYYGDVAPLKALSELTQKYGVLLAVDGAHGSHLACGADSHLHAGRYADMWVDGAHKTLPTLTQGAVLSVGHSANASSLCEHLEEGLLLVRTTSPSYPIMASVEYGVKFMYEHADVAEQKKTAVKLLRKRLPSGAMYENDDWTKVVIDTTKLGVSAEQLKQNLDAVGAFTEMCDGRYILFYLSLMSSDDEIYQIGNLISRFSVISANACESVKKVQDGSLNACGDGSANNLQSSSLNACDIGDAKKLQDDTFSPRTADVLNVIQNNAKCENSPFLQGEYNGDDLKAIRSNGEWVELEQAEGRTAICNIGITPPCTPLVIAGEKITQKHILALKTARDTFGIKGGKVKVLKTLSDNAD